MEDAILCFDGAPLSRRPCSITLREALAPAPHLPNSTIADMPPSSLTDQRADDARTDWRSLRTQRRREACAGGINAARRAQACTSDCSASSTPLAGLPTRRRSQRGSDAASACAQVAALKGLGLNVRRAKVGVNEKTGHFRHKFYITDATTRCRPPRTTTATHSAPKVCVCMEGTEG